MRMDNETYRLRVENLLATLVTPSGEWEPQILAELEGLALAPRRLRYFLRALNGQSVAVQVHFYRLILSRAEQPEEIADLERHIRHRYYEARDEIKEVLAGLQDPAVLPALFRVIALTEEGWLAGELIRLALSYPPEQLSGPVQQALHSGDYLLQCLAIYLIGKSQDPQLLDMLAEFYKKPTGEKLDRLQKKAHDALMEGGKQAPAELILRWMQHGHARIRELGVTLAEVRRLPEATGELVKLFLIDAKTRPAVARALLTYEAEEVLRFDPDDARAQPVARLMRNAKQDALQATLQALIRSENADVRQVAVKLIPFLREPEQLAGTLRRVASEDHVPAVQLAALRALARVDGEKLVAALVDLLDSTASADLKAAAEELMAEVLSPAAIEEVRASIEAKRQKREAALSRFAGGVEWWRHEIE